MSFEVLFSKFHFFHWWVLFFVEKFKQNAFWHFAATEFPLNTRELTFSPSVPCEWKCLSATYRSFVRKWNNPQCEVSGSTVHSNTRLNQAGPSVPGPGLHSPVHPRSPRSQLWAGKASESINEHHGEGLFVPARRDFCIYFSLCCGGFKLNQKKKKKKERKDKHSRSATSGHRTVLAACLPLLLSFVESSSPIWRRGLRSSIHRSGWRGALCFPEAAGWLNIRRRTGGHASSPLLCIYRVG